jgi:hypothetical protein
MPALSVLKTAVSKYLMDPNRYEVSSAGLVSFLNEAQRSIVKDCELNRVEIIVKVYISAGVVTASVEEKTQADAPTVKIEDWGGLTSLTIDDAITIYRTVRHRSSADGHGRPMDNLTDDQIDMRGLLMSGGDRPIGYRCVDGPTFRMVIYPPLPVTSSAYPYYLQIPYLMVPLDMSDDSDTPSIGVMYHDLVAIKAALTALKSLGKMDKAMILEGDYQRGLAVASGQQSPKDGQRITGRRRRFS